MTSKTIWRTARAIYFSALSFWVWMSLYHNTGWVCGAWVALAFCFFIDTYSTEARIDHDAAKDAALNAYRAYYVKVQEVIAANEERLEKERGATVINNAG